MIAPKNSCFAITKIKQRSCFVPKCWSKLKSCFASKMFDHEQKSCYGPKCTQNFWTPNLWTKVLLYTQVFEQKSCFALQIFEHMSFFTPKMFEQKSCFAPKRFEWQFCFAFLAKILKKSLALHHNCKCLNKTLASHPKWCNKIFALHPNML